MSNAQFTPLAKHSKTYLALLVCCTLVRVLSYYRSPTLTFGNLPCTLLDVLSVIFHDSEFSVKIREFYEI